MTESEIEALNRAHQLFAGGTRRPPLVAPLHMVPTSPVNTIVGQINYQFQANRGHQVLLSAARTDAAAAGVIADAHRDRAQARQLTKNVLDEARADAAAVTPIAPMAQRDAMRRRAARLRAQRAHVLTARLRARRHSAALRALHYRMVHHRGLLLPSPSSRAGIAVRAALSRLGRPYVWGATGPDQFDCSGLVQWAYARAGIHLDRTTYQQINDGIPVPRSQVRPGDLVFPHSGHVQMAIGNNLVVEAPYSGAAVRISRLGNYVAIRRPI
ncbi:NLP/P60 family protein [Mycobacterium lentiflavum]|uniref:C40 family peptidase n=1 Tax=Mycobacterium lentiflavum TaxID=141349 RepID=A0A0E4CL22_MYCLN|nr:C40 family peptidase [Mycobacterium lentiflavum]MEE3065455.1 C40 family peptidase [Actinomycetota bacterium]ULP42496.1 C40 family peptidase [Mycobacterium lentiflavum]CQD02714.1 NLP/P60 family protein [Mycobacterium lentiflavum]